MFTYHENTQYNQNHCHEKITRYERETFVLNLDFSNGKKYFLSIIFPRKIRKTPFGPMTTML